jgi:hypothetical protein
MKTVISLVFALACVLSLNAQIAATLTPLPDGSNEIAIKNNGSASLVAFAIVAHRKTGDGLSGSLASHFADVPAKFYFDSATDAATKPLLPNEQRTVAQNTVIMDRAPAPGRHFILFDEPIVTAGIFADGATTGDPVLLSRLMLRRSNMLLAVETAIDMLSDAGGRNIPRSQLIGQFSKMAASVNHWYLPPEQEVGRDLYLSIIDKLMHVPEGPLGSPFPPTAFVDQETAVLVQRRAALVEARPNLEDPSRSW